MPNSDSSYLLLRYDPVTGTLQYFSGADWYNCTLATGLNLTLANGKVLVGNASNLAAAVTMSGDATITNAGAITVPQAVHILSADPGTPTEGQIWYNTTSHLLKYYNGTDIKTVATV